MPVQKRKRGAPVGAVNNPTGKNQHACDRGKAVSARLPIDLDTRYREALAASGLTMTEAITEAVELWLTGREEK
jgi:hypothetical protein